MVHTSPLEQAGIGDAGGMNIYVIESAKRMAAMGMDVDIYTRKISGLSRTFIFQTDLCLFWSNWFLHPDVWSAHDLVLSFAQPASKE